MSTTTVTQRFKDRNASGSEEKPELKMCSSSTAIRSTAESIGESSATNSVNDSEKRENSGMAANEMGARSVLQSVDDGESFAMETDSGTARKRGEKESMQVEVTESRDEPKADQEVMETDTATTPKSEAPIRETSPILDDSDKLSVDDASLLADLFYLPYEHGAQSIRMLELVHWLRSHAHLVNNSADVAESSESTQWREKASEFSKDVKRVQKLTDKLLKIPNRALLYDLYPYVYDMRVILSQLDSYVKWMDTGKVSYSNVCVLRRLITWCTPGYKERFCSDEFEPWMFRGGLISDFQRMFPLEGSQDLFPNKVVQSAPASNPFFKRDEPSTSTNTTVPSFNSLFSSEVKTTLGADESKSQTISTSPSLCAYSKESDFERQHPKNNSSAKSFSSQIFLVRPFLFTDKSELYHLAAKICSKRLKAKGYDFANVVALGDVPGDRYLGAFLEHSPSYCHVLENNNGNICGYACGAIDAYSFIKFRSGAYFDMIQQKYDHIYGEEKNSIATKAIAYDKNGCEENGTARNMETTAAQNITPICRDMLNVLSLKPTELHTQSGAGVLSSNNDTYPSIVHFDISLDDITLCNAIDPSEHDQDNLTRRLMINLFSALKTNAAASSAGVLPTMQNFCATSMAESGSSTSKNDLKFSSVEATVTTNVSGTSVGSLSTVSTDNATIKEKASQKKNQSADPQDSFLLPAAVEGLPPLGKLTSVSAAAVSTPSQPVATLPPATLSDVRVVKVTTLPTMPVSVTSNVNIDVEKPLSVRFRRPGLSLGVYCEVDKYNQVQLETYKKYGFHEISLSVLQPSVKEKSSTSSSEDLASPSTTILARVV